MAIWDIGKISKQIQEHMSPSAIAERERREKIADQAFAESRTALRTALIHLRTLRKDVSGLPSSSDPSFNSAMVQLLFKHQRNIAVVAKRLLIIADPSSSAFRNALDKLIDLCQRNLDLKKSILAAGTAGLCDPVHARNQGPDGKPHLPHAWTAATQPDPKTHLCEPFFTGDPRDLRRDVVTHECFHILGLVDTAVNNTNDAFRNANTIAQIVAFLADRSRQANSDGNERAVPALPSP